MELVTLPEAARRLGIGVRQLYGARNRGEIRVHRIGAWQRVRWSDVQRWVEWHSVRPSTHARERLAEVLEREARADTPRDSE